MEKRQSIPLLIIAGPTATGKTEVAVQVAQKLNGEVISADSMLIYRYMDIGTAKPTGEEKKDVPHHLIDVVEPDQEYTAALFQQQARQTIEDIAGRGKIPILAGGTGFYIDAIIYDYDFSHTIADPGLRQFLKKEAEEKGNRAVHDRLRLVDPEAAEHIHANNLKRVIRALEVYRHTGVAATMQRGKNKQEYIGYDKLFFCLCYERNKLYQRIEKRVDLMIEHGLVREVRDLLNRGFHPELVSMQGLGYKEMVGYIQQRYLLEEAVHILKRNTRRFAKRQLTWFRRYSNIKWIDMGQYVSTDHVADEIVNRAREKWQVDRQRKIEIMPTEGT